MKEHNRKASDYHPGVPMGLPMLLVRESLLAAFAADIGPSRSPFLRLMQYLEPAFLEPQSFKLPHERCSKIFLRGFEVLEGL